MAYVTECPDYLFGEDCEKECHCSNITEICSKQTGYCQHSCHAGWIGIACDKRKKTISAYYNVQSFFDSVKRGCNLELMME